MKTLSGKLSETPNESHPVERVGLPALVIIEITSLELENLTKRKEASTHFNIFSLGLSLAITMLFFLLSTTLESRVAELVVSGFCGAGFILAIVFLILWEKEKRSEKRVIQKILNRTSIQNSLRNISTIEYGEELAGPQPEERSLSDGK